jgi:hypothetical protein
MKTTGLSAAIALGLAALAASADAADGTDRWQSLRQQLLAYRSALETVRSEHGGARALPAVDFFLFGMGERTKYLYGGGRLTQALTGEVVKTWEVGEELIVPPAYTVALRTKTGGLAVIVEDEQGLRIEEGAHIQELSAGSVSLPTFADRRHGLVLRVLHQELLVNVVDGRPVPNFFVYPKPWYRDTAMMAMVLAKTKNLHLLTRWIAGLREPYDRNNGGESEADNPGQILYLASLAGVKNDALIAAAQQALKSFEKDHYILGRSDFAAHPVYQTKWAKFGLQSAGLPDPYVVPQLDDNYATLFWWAFPDRDRPRPSVIVSDDYPYLTWAGCHSTGEKLGKLSDRDYPLTWEAQASQAQYEGMRRVSPAYTEQKLCAPHTWHAAEAFLYLFE